MGTKLETYIAAVSKRKSITRTSSGARINSAILQHVEGYDMPLMLEMLLVYQDGIDRVIKLCEEDTEEFARAVLCRDAIEELASTGDKSRWGDVEGH